MSSLVHADIFFFVTTVAVVVVAVLFAVVLVYLIKVLHQARGIMEEVRAETVLVREDIRRFRDDMERKGFWLDRLVSNIKRLFSKKRPRSK